MVAVGDAATAGEKELRRDYPNEEGLIVGTTTQEGRQPFLIPEEGSTIPDREKVGL